MFKTIINFASTIQGRRFASAYKAGDHELAYKRLETYKTMRRWLPIPCNSGAVKSPTFPLTNDTRNCTI
jgi:hypothetical protein